MARKEIVLCDEHKCKSQNFEQMFDITVGRDKHDNFVRWEVNFVVTDDLGGNVDMCPQCLFFYIEGQFDRIQEDFGKDEVIEVHGEEIVEDV
jgi:hypothetical protein